MKKIEALVNPVSVNAIRAALCELGIGKFTVSEVQRFGQPKRERIVRYRGSDCAVDSMPESKFEIIVADSQTDAAVDAIIRTCRPVEMGKEDLVVFPLEIPGSVPAQSRIPRTQPVAAAGALN